MNHGDLQLRPAALDHDTGKPNWGPLMRAGVMDELTKRTDYLVTTHDIMQAAPLWRSKKRKSAVYDVESSGDGAGSVTAGAIIAFAPDFRAFASGRNFAAWLVLVPRPDPPAARRG